MPATKHIERVARLGAITLAVAASFSLVACKTSPPQHEPQAQAPATGPGGCIYATKPAPAQPDTHVRDRNKAIAIGALVGALGGAAVGSQVADKSSVGARNGALLGGLVGALGGNVYANQIKATEQPDGSVKMDIPGSIMFATDSSALAPDFRSTLDAVGRTMARYCGVNAEITGHTDSTGSLAHNQELSLRRAESTQVYLQGVLRNAGVSDRTLTIRGLGPSQPVADNATEAGRAQNRRVEILLQPPQS